MSCTKLLVAIILMYSTFTLAQDRTAKPFDENSKSSTSIASINDCSSVDNKNWDFQRIGFKCKLKDGVLIEKIEVEEGLLRPQKAWRFIGDKVDENLKNTIWFNPEPGTYGKTLRTIRNICDRYSIKENKKDMKITKVETDVPDFLLLKSFIDSGAGVIIEKSPYIQLASYRKTNLLKLLSKTHVPDNPSLVRAIDFEKPNDLDLTINQDEGRMDAKEVHASICVRKSR